MHNESTAAVASAAPPVPPPIVFCEQLIAGFKKKADHNKAESQGFFAAVIISTLATPLFVTLGEGLIPGKLIPSLLSAVAAGATAWLQLRKPQQLWGMYRTAQRELEDNRNRYRYGLAPYSDSMNRDNVLAEKISDLAIAVHHQWMPMIPSLDQLRLPTDGRRGAVDKPAPRGQP
jgi:hypothetical protein